MKPVLILSTFLLLSHGGFARGSCKIDSFLTVYVSDILEYSKRKIAYITLDSSVFICDDNFSRRKVKKVNPIYYTKRKNGSLWIRGQLIKKESNADTLKSDIALRIIRKEKKIYIDEGTWIFHVFHIHNTFYFFIDDHFEKRFLGKVEVN